ncbi:MAG: GNAT family N-acetyltransferase [Nocardioides sp.]
MIRVATDTDSAVLEALEVELFGAGAWGAEALLGSAGGPVRWVRVATDQADEVAAYVVTTGAAEAVDLLRIGVRPDHQRRGLAGILLTAAVDAARTELGADRMLLEVSHANEPAVRLYHGHGFEVIDRRRRYYPDGTDALVMQIDLTD